jgi:hypothetical protein
MFLGLAIASAKPRRIVIDRCKVMRRNSQLRPLRRAHWTAWLLVVMAFVNLATAIVHSAHDSHHADSFALASANAAVLDPHGLQHPHDSDEFESGHCFQTHCSHLALTLPSPALMRLRPLAITTAAAFSAALPSPLISVPFRPPIVS